MNRVLKTLALMFAVLSLATPAMAQDAAATPAAAAPLVGGAVGVGLVIIGLSLGIGRIGGSACEAAARQPEAWGSIQTGMIISAALIEGAGLFGLIICGFILG